MHSSMTRSLTIGRSVQTTYYTDRSMSLSEHSERVEIEFRFLSRLLVGSDSDSGWSADESEAHDGNVEANVPMRASFWYQYYTINYQYSWDDKEKMHYNLMVLREATMLQWGQYRGFLVESRNVMTVVLDFMMFPGCTRVLKDSVWLTVLHSYHHE
jgi:hypothetical protein